MRLLVTGGAGYVGSVVTRLLLEQGHEVVVFDNLERGHREAVAPGARLTVGDLRDPHALERVFAAPDAARTHGPPSFDGVLHFAALSLVGESVKHPERYYRTNVGGTLNLLEAMVAAGVPRLVFSSTAAVYGQPERIPITEAAPALPTNPYGASKLAVDGMIGAFCEAHGLGATSLRYFNVAGAGNGAGEDHRPETHLIPNVLRVALGLGEHVEIFGTDYPTPDGTAIRDYIHIDDLAEAHLLALEACAPDAHRIFNLGNGKGFSVRQVLETAREVTGREIAATHAPRRPGDPPQLIASSDLIRTELGWTPRKPGLIEMIADAWDFARSRPHGYGER